MRSRKFHGQGSHSCIHLYRESISQLLESRTEGQRVKSWAAWAGLRAQMGQELQFPWLCPECDTSTNALHYLNTPCATARLAEAGLEHRWSCPTGSWKSWIRGRWPQGAAQAGMGHRIPFCCSLRKGNLMGLSRWTNEPLQSSCSAQPEHHRVLQSCRVFAGKQMQQCPSSLWKHHSWNRLRRKSNIWFFLWVCACPCCFLRSSHPSCARRCQVTWGMNSLISGSRQRAFKNPKSYFHFLPQSRWAHARPLVDHSLKARLAHSWLSKRKGALL